MHLYRRICLLRATGAAEEAGRLEAGEFARAKAEAAASEGDGPSWPSRLAAEEKRVAEASILAELLAPLLAERLRRPGRSATTDGLSAVLDAFPAKSAARTFPRGAALEVADLIEGMLALERDEDRQRSKPRAS